MLITALLILDRTEWSAAEDRLMCCVSPDRKARIVRYLHPADRLLSLYAGLTARLLIAECTGAKPGALVFCSPKNRKPSLIGLPDIDFSLSHTRNAVLCSVSNEGRVGADVEKIEEPPPYSILPQVFHPAEIRRINETPPDRRTRCFYEIWTRKEAWTKQDGIGLAGDPAAIDTGAADRAHFLSTSQTGPYICSVSHSGAIPPPVQILNASDVRDAFTGG